MPNDIISAEVHMGKIGRHLDQGRASKNLEALKLVDFVLRHERSSSLEALTPQGLQLLAKARDTALQPPDDHATWIQSFSCSREPDPESYRKGCILQEEL